MILRSLEASDDAAEAFARYEATRIERTSRIQLASRQNTWGKHALDPSGVYGYDVWETSLSPPRA
jgi:6-hydroxynicotinate 3-monooxygenase